MLIDRFLWVFRLFCLWCRRVLFYEPMDDLESIGYLLMILNVFLDLLWEDLREACGFNRRARHEGGNRFISFGLSSRFFTHRGNRMGENRSPVSREGLQGSSNLLKMYDLILRAFMEPYIQDYRRKYRWVMRVGCPCDSIQNQQFLNFRPYQS
jgi:hypothetical protein